MQKKIVIATQNQGKVKEFRALLGEQGFELLSLADFPACPDVVEDGTTFQENAIKKAVEVAKFTGLVAIADDSGLVVDPLGGEPGVYSARYAGEPKSDSANNEKLLAKVKDIPVEQRTARFVAAIAVATPAGKAEVVEGSCEGLIVDEPQGENGFGYDPLFYVPQFEQTMAELSMEAKNKISHRGQALKQAIELLPRFFEV